MFPVGRAAFYLGKMTGYGVLEWRRHHTIFIVMSPCTTFHSYAHIHNPNSILGIRSNIVQ